MKRIIFALLTLVLLPCLAQAQKSDNPSQGKAYFFFAPIVTNTRFDGNPAYFHSSFPPGVPLPADLYLKKRGGLNTGFGGEVFAYRGLGLGVEVGYVGPDWNFNSGGTGVGSANASYHFSRSNRVEPFLTGGYSLFFGHGEVHGYNLGGGVNLWLSKHVALRLEARDFPAAGSSLYGVGHFASLRFGLTFR